MREGGCYQAAISVLELRSTPVDVRRLTAAAATERESALRDLINVVLDGQIGVLGGERMYTVAQKSG